MIRAIKKLFGLHSHQWGLWHPIRASDLSVIGRRRRCVTCRMIQEEFYPDGH